MSGQTSTASFTAQDSDLTRFGVAHIGKHEDRPEEALVAFALMLLRPKEVEKVSG